MEDILGLVCSVIIINCFLLLSVYIAECIYFDFVKWRNQK